MDEKDKKEYELAVLVKSEDDLASVATLVKNHNGELTAEPRPKKLAFAYEIKKIKEGVFAHLLFKAAGEDAKNLERDLRTAPEVIRALIIASPAPAMMLGERPVMPAGGGSMRRPRTGMRPSAPASTGAGTDTKPAAPAPLSNEALEKKIEEILQ
jgi:ribosomal protein S6